MAKGRYKRTGTRILRSCAAFHFVFATRNIATLLEFGKIRRLGQSERSSATHIINRTRITGLRSPCASPPTSAVPGWTQLRAITA
jgi:hypothetical protein